MNHRGGSRHGYWYFYKCRSVGYERTVPLLKTSEFHSQPRDKNVPTVHEHEHEHEPHCASRGVMTGTNATYEYLAIRHRIVFNSTSSNRLLHNNELLVAL